MQSKKRVRPKTTKFDTIYYARVNHAYFDWSETYRKKLGLTRSKMTDLILFCLMTSGKVSTSDLTTKPGRQHETNLAGHGNSRA